MQCFTLNRGDFLGLTAWELTKYCLLFYPVYLYTLAPCYDFLRRGVHYFKTRLLFLVIPSLITRLIERRSRLADKIREAVDKYIKEVEPEWDNKRIVPKERMDEAEWLNRSILRKKRAGSISLIEKEVEEILWFSQ